MSKQQAIYPITGHHSTFGYVMQRVARAKLNPICEHLGQSSRFESEQHERSDAENIGQHLSCMVPRIDVGIDSLDTAILVDHETDALPMLDL